MKKPKKIKKPIFPDREKGKKTRKVDQYRVNPETRVLERYQIEIPDEDK